MKHKNLLMLLIVSLLLTGCGPIDKDNYAASLKSDTQLVTQSSTNPTDSMNEMSKEDDTTEEISLSDVTPLSEFTSKTYPLKPNDIEFSFEQIEGEVEGEPLYRLNYKNNTPYTLTSISFHIAYKEDTNKEDRSMRGTTVVNNKIVKPGEYVTGSLMREYDLTPVNSIEDYDTENPVMMYLSLSDDDVTEYTYRYNFDEKKFDVYQEGGNCKKLIWMEKTEWFPDSPVYKADKCGSCEDDFLLYRFYGMTENDYHEYVSKVKNKGFSQITSEGYYTFNATNDSGDSVSISYDFYNETINITVEKCK